MTGSRFRGSGCHALWRAWSCVRDTDVPPACHHSKCTVSCAEATTRSAASSAYARSAISPGQPIRKDHREGERAALVEQVDAAQDQDFAVSLTGVKLGRSLATVSAKRPDDHLQFWRKTSRALLLRVRPEVFFLDLKLAALKSGVLSDGSLKLAYFKRWRSSGSNYAFDSTALEQAMVAGGLSRFDSSS